MRYWCAKLETPICGLIGYAFFIAETEEEAKEKAWNLCVENAYEWWNEDVYECEDYNEEDWVAEASYELEENTAEQYWKMRL